MELLTSTGPGQNIKKDSEILMENIGMEIDKKIMSET